MSRDILIISESNFLRTVTKSYAQSELSDVVLETAASAEEALALLEKKPYDVIISSLEMSGQDGGDVFRSVSKIEANQGTPFIIMTSTRTPEQKRRLSRLGVQHVLYTPFTREELARAVDEARHPREKRTARRHSIPGVTAVVHLNNAPFPASVLNISEQGVWYEMECPENDSGLLRTGRVDLRFPPEYGLARVEGLTAAVLRINVMSFRDDHNPRVIRVAREFVNMTKAAQATMKMLLGRAETEMTMPEDGVND